MRTSAANQLAEFCRFSGAGSGSFTSVYDVQSDFLQDSSNASVAAFRQTELVNLCSDARGNAFLNQYVVVKDLKKGAFGKVIFIKFPADEKQVQPKNVFQPPVRAHGRDAAPLEHAGARTKKTWG